MKCNVCGKELSEGASFCPECGTKVNDVKTGDLKGSITVEKGTTIVNNDTPVSNSKAVASLVLGIISIFLGTVFIIIPLVGLILGIAQKGKSGLKVAGIVINAVFLALSLLIWLFILIFGIAAYQSEHGGGYYESREENNGNSDIIIKDNDYDDIYDDLHEYEDFFDFNY